MIKIKRVMNKDLLLIPKIYLHGYRIKHGLAATL